MALVRGLRAECGADKFGNSGAGKTGYRQGMSKRGEKGCENLAVAGGSREEDTGAMLRRIQDSNNRGRGDQSGASHVLFLSFRICSCVGLSSLVPGEGSGHSCSRCTLRGLLAQAGALLSASTAAAAEALLCRTAGAPCGLPACCCWCRRRPKSAEPCLERWPFRVVQAAARRGANCRHTGGRGGAAVSGGACRRSWRQACSLSSHPPACLPVGLPQGLTSPLLNPSAT